MSIKANPSSNLLVFISVWSPKQPHKHPHTPLTIPPFFHLGVSPAALEFPLGPACLQHVVKVGFFIQKYETQITFFYEVFPDASHPEASGTPVLPNQLGFNKFLYMNSLSPPSPLLNWKKGLKENELMEGLPAFCCGNYGSPPQGPGVSCSIKFFGKPQPGYYSTCSTGKLSLGPVPQLFHAEPRPFTFTLSQPLFCRGSSAGVKLSLPESGNLAPAFEVKWSLHPSSSAVGEIFLNDCSLLSALF